MTKYNIKIPEGTLRSQIQYLMDNHPELSRLEMAEILGKGVGTVYSYVHTIKKSQERQAQKEQKEVSPMPIFEESSIPVEDTPVIESPPVEEEVIEWAEPKSSDNVPNSLDFSLTGVSGDNLQRLLFNLLKNSLSDDGEYSFVLSIEKTK